MPKYRTPKGRIFVLGTLTPDKHADAMEEKYRVLRGRERLGDLGESKVYTKGGLHPLSDAETQNREARWARYTEELLADVRAAEPA